MPNQPEHIIYSAADIERYLLGAMSAKEMHDMERAALQDPFLADAIEGFNELPDFTIAAKHLNEIAARVQGKQTEAVVVPMPTNNGSGWWRIAAAIAVTAGIAFIGFFMWGNTITPENKDIAFVPPVIIDTTTNVATPIPDTAQLLAQQITANHKAAQYFANRSKTLANKQLPYTIATETPLAAEQPTTDDVANANNIDALETKSAFTSGNPAYSVPAAAMPAYDSGTTANLLSFKGRVLDNNLNPVANALVNATGQKATVTNADGYFTIQAPDTSLTVTVSSIGFNQQQAQLQANAANKIALAPDNKSLSEVVVTGYASKKKASMRSVTTDSAFPAGGWESFQDYVYKKLHQKLDSTNNGPKVMGNVEIEFQVNEDGKPFNFNIVQSLDETSDKKAINILKEGPRWIANTKRKKARVTIPF
jgi:CarboxypepD_reg-like domain